MGKLKAHELRTKGKSELLGQLADLKSELSTLRVAKVTGAAPARVAKIGVVRKNIARVLTVYNQLSKSKLREKILGDGKKLPNVLRAKTTRAMRRRLSPEQMKKKTLRQKKKDTHFPQRVYAVKAAV